MLTQLVEAGSLPGLGPDTAGDIPAVVSPPSHPLSQQDLGLCLRMSKHEIYLFNYIIQLYGKEYQVVKLYQLVHVTWVRSSRSESQICSDDTTVRHMLGLCGWWSNLSRDTNLAGS